MKRFLFSVGTLVLAAYLGLAGATQAQKPKQKEVQIQKNPGSVARISATGTAGKQTIPKVGVVQHGRRFVDADGDGYNDNAPDADGDGIPNGLDPDYTGPKTRAGRGARGFIDLNGDGINDNAIDSDGDGIPNGRDPDYVRPADGSGARRMFGRANRGRTGIPGVIGNGTCTGTGPKGRMGRKGRGK